MPIIPHIFSATVMQSGPAVTVIEGTPEGTRCRFASGKA